MNVCNMEFLKIRPTVQAFILGYRHTDGWTNRDNLHVRHPFLICEKHLKIQTQVAFIPTKH
jgi:hypothetical protein